MSIYFLSLSTVFKIAGKYINTKTKFAINHQIKDTANHHHNSSFKARVTSHEIVVAVVKKIAINLDLAASITASVVFMFSNLLVIYLCIKSIQLFIHTQITQNSHNCAGNDNGIHVTANIQRTHINDIRVVVSIISAYLILLNFSTSIINVKINHIHRELHNSHDDFSCVSTSAENQKVIHFGGSFCSTILTIFCDISHSGVFAVLSAFTSSVSSHLLCWIAFSSGSSSFFFIIELR